MILIRLKKQSSDQRLTYSIVVSKKHSSPQTEGFIENIGHYKPLIDKWSNKYVFIDFDRLLFWIKRGAKFNAGLYVLIRPLIVNFFKSGNL